jgi:hypothetical protein
MGGAGVQLILLLIAAQSAAPETAPGQTGSEAVLQFRILSQLTTCSASDPDEIVVCGRRGGDERYRIPKILREEEEPGRRIAGHGAASLDAEPYAPCGIFEGQRKCNKADAAHFGYGNGRDPITVARKIIAEISDPD